jgi:hypothetical protein
MMDIRATAIRAAAWLALAPACLLAFAASGCSTDPRWTTAGWPMDRGAPAACDDPAGMSPPVLVDGLAPHYPPLYAYDRKPGQATVVFDILPDGSTSAVRPTVDSDKYFAGALAMVVKDWRFQPVTGTGGTAIVAHCRTHFDFEAD